MQGTDTSGEKTTEKSEGFIARIIDFCGRKRSLVFLV